MNFKNIYVLCCTLLVSLPTLACQPGSKFKRNYGQKLSKNGLRVGPDRNQRSRQDAWELLKAKRAQRVPGGSLRSELASYVALAKLFDQITPTMSACGNSYSLSARACSKHPIMAAVLFGLLLIPSVAGDASRNFDSDDYNFGFSDCDTHRGLITSYRDVFKITIETAHKHSETLGEINFPAIPDVWCPDFSERYHRAAMAGDRTRENIVKVRQFMREFQSKEKELYRRMDDYNKHLEVSSACENSALLISEQTTRFDESRESARMLGGAIVFPSTPEIQCPSMKNWQQWNVQQAEAETQSAATYLHTFNQRVDELNKLIDDYNKHCAAADTCQEYANLLSQQQAYFDEIRQDALIINNQLGKLILFPETPQITCQSMERWSEWSVVQVEAYCEVARKFLAAFNHGIAELNELVNEYNKRMEKGVDEVITLE